MLGTLIAQGDAAMVAEFIEALREDPLVLEDLFTLLRFRSMSTEPAALEACAVWLGQRIAEMGMDVELIPTEGPPIVVASNRTAPDRPTLLLYNHYDVQPVEPISEWSSDPFSPVIRDGNIYARGAQDNKGQLAFVLAALRHLHRRGPLPCNIVWVIDGEEEIGSPQLARLLPHLGELVWADDLLIVDGGIPAMDQPMVELGARGITTIKLQLQGSSTDLHSGQLGGLAYNPLRAACELCSSLWHPDGSVAVAGFYDDCLELDPELVQRLHPGLSEAVLKEHFGLTPTGGEHSLALNRRNWLRPCLEINGISGGYTGNGFKTVIPAKTEVHLSARLVANQQPQAVAERISKHLEERCPAGIDLRIEVGHGGLPLMGNPQGWLTRSASIAYQELLGHPCALGLTGGSLPVCALLAQVSGAQPLVVGLGLPTDSIHAADEHFSIDRVIYGAAWLQRVIDLYR